MISEGFLLSDIGVFGEGGAKCFRGRLRFDSLFGSGRFQ